ncbi:hypothetical protein Taro_056417, partial [Colocasia esculenta]|nr:hypothetical protein [Colocasia esculenta]
LIRGARQAEKELQSKKSQILLAKRSNVRRAEQRCLLLEKHRAEVCCRILSKKAEIEAVEARYQSTATALRRALMAEADAIEEKGKEKDGFYETKVSEMEEFKKQVRGRTLGLRQEVQNLRTSVFELRSALQKLQENDGCLNNPEIAAAKEKKAELSAAKESLERKLAANVELRSLLQRQLRRVLSSEAVRGEEQTKQLR